MTEKQEIANLLHSIFNNHELISATFSAPRSPTSGSKIVVRPLLIKGQPHYQLTQSRGQQAFHQNLSQKEFLKWFEEHFEAFKQVFVYTGSADYQLLIGKKGNMTLLKKAPSKAPAQWIHNREKDYLLREGEPLPFLIHLGVMNKEGKVYSTKQDKFRQINRFLEMINDVLIHFNFAHPLRIVDFGCGKAYLTFALYHFLKNTKGYAVKMVGIDLKQEVIDDCQKLSHALGSQESLTFICDDIDHYDPKEGVDLVISLHACDVATDAALEKGIRWESKVILSVPCCQHELMPQIQQELLTPLLKHGILKERFAALATDAARAQLLEILGYQTQILEFIDVEHTAKNLLIRAIKRQKWSDEHRNVAWNAYFNFKQTLHIMPSLEGRFQQELPTSGLLKKVPSKEQG
ncbi:MAG: class I SAM-dependent methyltransferase [Parachlamydiaceae bacterium]